VRLSQQLQACGYDGDPVEFANTLPRLLEELFPGETDEGLMCDPQGKAIPYCETVRSRFHVNFPDTLILRTLTNTRKASRRKPKATGTLASAD
jgi:hypothetical protein